MNLLGGLALGSFTSPAPFPKGRAPGYEQFYGLKCRPFESSPDPRLFFPTPSHNLSLATLSSCVLHRKGCVVLTGEAGTGKTLLLRCLVEFIVRNRIACAFVYKPQRSALDFLVHVLNELGLSVIGRTKAELLSYLNDYVLVRSCRGSTTAILVDEADLLDREVLQEICMLKNHENSQRKTVQIVLVGQPALEEKLNSALPPNERSSLRCRLRPLGATELEGYVERRLKLAGANLPRASIFPPEAIESIYEVSRGIPSLVNVVCEKSLISGFESRTQKITADVVRGIASDLRLRPMPAPGS